MTYEVNNPLIAYFIGAALGDGYVDSANAVYFNVGEHDKHFIEALIEVGNKLPVKNKRVEVKEIPPSKRREGKKARKEKVISVRIYGKGLGKLVEKYKKNPKLLLKDITNPEAQIALVRGLFDAEGNYSAYYYIRKDSRSGKELRVKVRFTNTDPNIIELVLEICKKFGILFNGPYIDTKDRKRPKYYIEITSQNMAKRFYNTIKPNKRPTRDDAGIFQEDTKHKHENNKQPNTTKQKSLLDFT